MESKQKIQDKNQKQKVENKNIFWKYVPLIFFTALIFQIGVFFFTRSQLPQLKEVGFPLNFEQAQQFSKLMSNYVESNYYTLLFFQASNFLFLQTFCVPGTFIFNLLGGAFFGVKVGFIVCVLCNTFGAYFCFLLSKYFGKEIIETKLQKQVAFMKKQVDEHRKELLFYMLSLRVFPGSPNWLMNISFPHINIPQSYFLISQFFGLMPWNFITVEAGNVISTFKNKDEIMKPQNQLMLAGLAFLCILPGLIKSFNNYRQKKKDQKQKQN
ncbi:hypothetical protein PPERSA_07692 [Pseudocohnilembus persalinus]|uniref:VTT domain-containing protein n=1 Tax=Pseudocohnilembus persalinus TaxID=266149 RepID=A0A0V0QID4_PSEPJ|nr:hypothetical protein PPERSA_07692 [Pseudocohnilembus persalinus]|eukprot:KRX02047.1 hypothetical protein PPERSA_07692 [Pseudocohnilembus persalinus]